MARKRKEVLVKERDKLIDEKIKEIKREYAERKKQHVEKVLECLDKTENAKPMMDLTIRDLIYQGLNSGFTGYADDEIEEVELFTSTLLHDVAYWIQNLVYKEIPITLRIHKNNIEAFEKISMSRKKFED